MASNLITCESVAMPYRYSNHIALPLRALRRDGIRIVSGKDPMFSTSLLDLSEQHPKSQAEADPYEEPFIAVQAMREIALQRASELASDYIERRTALQKSDGVGFIGIALYVRERNDRRSIQLEWTVGHFRGGVKTGSTSIPKRRGSPQYDLAALKRETPPWAHDLVVETELKARVIRDALLRMVEADEALKVAARRLKEATEESDPDAGDNGSGIDHEQMAPDQ